jgi:hypothetical protein
MVSGMETHLKRKKVKIGNQQYALVGVQDLKDPELADEESENLFGSADFEACAIRFNNTYPASFVDETIVHEILEVLKHSVSECNFSELQIDLIARTMVQVLHQFRFSFTKKTKEVPPV